jgi:hypothetical protein
MRCECCGQEVPPTLSAEDFTARAGPRLEALDRLSARIEFSRHGWEYTDDGARWKHLMDDQGRDEAAAGL